MAYFYKTTVKRVHNECFPSNFRMLIVGMSGAGKTALLIKMLLDTDLLNYEKLYVFAKSLYQVLRAGLENGLSKTYIIKLMNSDTILKKNNTGIDEAAMALAECNEENEIEPSNIECEFQDSSDEIPDPKDLNKNIRNLIVFDDVMCDKNKLLLKAIIPGEGQRIATAYIQVKITPSYHCTLFAVIQTSWCFLNRHH